MSTTIFNTPKIKRVLLDVDDVLADFQKAAAAIHGVDIAEFRKVSTDWNMTIALSKILSKKMSDADFWKPINSAGEEFWTGLDLFPWTMNLVSRLSSTNLIFCTSPSRCPYSYSGKVKWIKCHFSSIIANPRVWLIDEKEAAGANSILLDDKLSNVVSVSDNGGIGVLFDRREAEKDETYIEELAHTIYGMTLKS